MLTRLGVLEVRGTDRIAFLQSLLTNDITRLAAGTGCEAALLDASGKVQALLLVLADADAHWLLTQNQSAEALRGLLERYHMTEDVVLLPHADAARQDAPPGLAALEARRLEAGVPVFGVDVTPEHLLPETGLDARFASGTKGCYVGQEIVARMQTYGSANKKLVGLRFDTAEAPASGAVIVKDGQPVGAVTSAAISPSLGCAIALGYVKRPHYEAIGAAVECDGRRAALAALPFIG